MTSITIPQRQHWMRILALTPPERLAEALAPALSAHPGHHWLRRPETGLVMLRGRAGGTGAQFNLGEASVTRASVSLAGQIGHAWVRGSNARHAELAALADALLQCPAHHADLMAGVIAPLEAELVERRATVSRAAAASKVEFFTMVRGE
ncbi:phosphonate C-P lyase system protein PhnG [Crenobacter sp. SG2303]|uniref:Phosphonate C-P lyase system protein PhnG n=1 Tax=Crenobacter oryzisoli TaxID=3056844 RepID=A0ABT7XN86_9NEIS|nr:phosphonate C-P lyase system protein PhnG [Crenobacter sp. SG2303]MDN0075261.1 phosphonate C-P lyase system protein PhnG [Crenobacter sp. SG2303]